ncbi:DUF7314 family protein [Haloarcula salina]|uniref:DUF7314 family protein n=1 Tax=Haloarcula salina TaxID=1429914 RepID=UPI003C6FF329
MADEFMKGFACLMIGGLGWMTIGGWYRTPSFEGAQITGEVTIENPTLYDQIGLFMGEAFFWFAVFGALTFWVLLPLVSEFRTYLDERSA